MLIEKSLVNCHIEGLHSLVLSENPMRRIFFTTPGHKLNKVDSIAAHPHHCDLIIIPLWGNIFNTVYILNMFGAETCNRYMYNSQIKSGNGSFVLDDTAIDLLGFTSKVEAPMKLKSTDIHTIYTTSDRAAWLILEGDEDPTYNSVCYAKELPILTSNLYQPMTKEFLMENFHK